MEWFCTDCGKTIFSNNPPICCNKTMTEFNLDEAEKKLKVNSNGWVDVWHNWKNHPKLKKVSDELKKDQCHSSPIHLNKFIETILKENEDLKEELEDYKERLQKTRDDLIDLKQNYLRRS